MLASPPHTSKPPLTCDAEADLDSLGGSRGRADPLSATPVLSPPSSDISKASLHRASSAWRAMGDQLGHSYWDVFFSGGRSGSEAGEPILYRPLSGEECSRGLLMWYWALTLVGATLRSCGLPPARGAL